MNENEVNDSPAPRIPLKLDVEYRKSYGRSQEIGILKNISLSGAFLEHTNEEIKVEDKWLEFLFLLIF